MSSVKKFSVITQKIYCYLEMLDSFLEGDPVCNCTACAENVFSFFFRALHLVIYKYYVGIYKLICL